MIVCTTPGATNRGGKTLLDNYQMCIVNSRQNTKTCHLGRLLKKLKFQEERQPTRPPKQTQELGQKTCPECLSTTTISLSTTTSTIPSVSAAAIPPARATPTPTIMMSSSETPTVTYTVMMFMVMPSTIPSSSSSMMVVVVVVGVGLGAVRGSFVVRNRVGIDSEPIPRIVFVIVVVIGTLVAKVAVVLVKYRFARY